jgi:hypothetical protein
MLSPRSKGPLTVTMPAGRSDRPRFSAEAAPSSMCAAALPARPERIHLLRLSTLVRFGENRVPIRSPVSALASTSVSVPRATTTAIPDSVARRAACTFVTMPPVPRSVPAPAASATTASVMAGTSSISVAVGLRRGSAV